MSVSQASIEAGSSGRWSGNLAKDSGVRVGAANVTDARCTLTNAATGTVMGGRNNQQVVLNGVAVSGTKFDITDTTDAEGAAITALGWHIQPADTEMEVTSPDVDAESHRAFIKVTYADGAETKVIEHVHRMECTDTLGVCTYDDVALMLPGVEDGASEDLIGMFIRLLTRRIERLAQRKLRKATTDTTEIVTPYPGEGAIWLSRWPIDAVSSIKEDTGGAFTGSAMDATSYHVAGSRGRIDLKGFGWIGGPGSVRVAYTGGLYRETGACPEDLRFTAARQVAFMMQRVSQLGVTSISMGGDSVQIGSVVKDLLPEMHEQIRLLSRARL